MEDNNLDNDRIDDKIFYSGKPGFRTFHIHKVSCPDACLFECIRFGVHYLAPHTVQEIRNIVSNAILSQPDVFSEVVLEMPPEQYANWIKKPDAWGGFIELSILTDHFRIQIAVVDAQTLHTHVYGEKYTWRIFLLYENSHYDAIYAMDSASQSEEPKVTNDYRIFPCTDEDAHQQVQNLIKSRKLK